MENFTWRQAIRITISEIKKHPWFLKNLPIELMEGGSLQGNDINTPSQSIDEVLAILQVARTQEVAKAGLLSLASLDLDDLDDADIEEDIEASGDFVCAI
ncbi:hypothetical protein ACH5RR_034618 [Cinchona calisaya]|uniref:Uncharacterized protein n=1 Tax=Cinchona calisaya TaxID=153742 RepID=A0ABD2YBF6_9GENT